MRMKKMLKTASVFFTMAVLSTGMLCTKKYEFNNPVATNYQGAYALHVKWQSLPSPLYLDTAYRVFCGVSAPPDTFASIILDSADAYYADLSVAKTPSPDTMALYFTFKHPFSGTLHVLGIHPNGKQTRDSGVVSVVNQYKPVVAFEDTPTFVGKGVSPVMVTMGGMCGVGKRACDTIQRIYWKSGNYGKTDSQIVSMVAGFTTINETVSGAIGGKDTLQVWAIGKKGYSSDIISLVRTITGYVPLFHGIDLADTLQCGDTLRFKIKYDTLHQTKVRAIVSRDSGTYKDTSALFACDTSAVIIMRRPFVDTGKVRLSVGLQDSSGVLSGMIAKDSIYLRYKLPELSIPKTIDVPLNMALTISVTLLDSFAIECVWIFGGDKPDTTLGPSITTKIYTTAEATDTVRVLGVNKWGYAGKQVQAVIIVKKIKYALTTDSTAFPTSIAAKRAVSFGVKMDSMDSFTANGGKYHWRIDSASKTLWDTTAPGLSSITRTFPDNGVATITVAAYDKIGDTSNTIQRQVVVHRYPPQCVFAPRTQTVRINRLDTLLLHYSDSNPDGSGVVDSVYWDVNGDENAEFVNYRDSTLVVSYPSSGVYTVLAWVKDNDRFVSEKDSVRITVTSDRPYRSGTIPDTAVYIGTALLMKAQFLPGDNQSPIAHYTWHINGAEHPSDTVTLTADFTRKFDSAGVDTITVNCKDEDSLTAVAPDTFVVRVSKGEPVVTGITPHTAWTNAMTQYTVLSTSVRPGTRVVGYYVAWDGGTAFTWYDTSPFTYKDNGSGTRRIRMYVQDNDSIESAIVSDSIVVRLGKPIVRAIRPDSMVFIKDARHYTISALDSATGKISMYYVSANGGAFRQSKDSTFDTIFTSPGVVKMRVVVKNDREIYSDTLSDSVVVNVGLPLITKIAPDISKDSIFVLDARAFTIKGRDSHGRIDSVKVSWNGAAQFTESVTAVGDSATLTHTFGITDTAIRNIRVRLVNDGAQTADSLYAIRVRLGKPMVDAIAPQTVWVNDDTTFVITARDTNGTVDSLIIDWGDGTATVRQAAASLTHHKYAVTQYGAKAVKVTARDNDGIYSDTARFAMTVQQGKPAVSSVTLDTAITKIFINQPVKFFVHGHDDNGRIDSIKVAWNGDTAFNQTIAAKADTAMFSNSFATTGTKQVRFRVKDDDRIVADTIISLFVHQGRPKVLAFTPDSAVFIKDTYTYTISAMDTNGTVASYWVALDNGAFAQSAPVGAATVTKALATAGKHPVNVYVIDNDGLYSDTLHDTVIVRLAAPVIDSMRVPATIWINDTSTYQVFARDTNGPIIQYYFDWTNSVTWQDSSTTGSALGHFNTAGIKTIRVGVMDNDSNVTTSTKQVTVHLGAPHVWNSTGDTMFVVTPDGGGNDTLRISHYDTNGTIQTFYWAMNSVTGLDTAHAYSKGPADTLVYNITPTGLNAAFQMAVFGKDDDGNVGGDTFLLYPDAPPPAPEILNPPSGDITNGLTLRWQNQDVKDGTATQFQILISYTSADPGTVLSTFKPGTQYTISGSEYRYTFTPTSGTFKIQVVAKDARGSITASDIAAYSY